MQILNAPIPVLAAASLLAACGTGGSAPEAVVRDSAGITIVENAPGAAESVPHWILGPEPDFRIGVIHGDEAYQFHRVWSGALLSDGRFAIADGGSSQVRVFDGDGRVVAVQGQRGEGPGEYVIPVGLWVLPGDSIAVFDPRVSRVTILHVTQSVRAGRAGSGDWLDVARVVPVKHGLMNPDFAGTLEGGRRVVVVDRQNDISGPIQPQYADVWTVPLDEHDDGAPADFVLRYVHGHHGAVPGGEETGPRVGSPIFGAHGMAAARGDRIVVGSGDAYAVEIHGPDGRLRRIVRWHGPDRTVSPEAVAAWKDAVVAAIAESRRARTRRWIDRLPVAERTPAHHRLLLDDTGRLWVSRWAALPREIGTEWWVFDPDGRLVATAEMPEGLTVLDIGDGMVLGKVQDALGMEYVVGVAY